MRSTAISSHATLRQTLEDRFKERSLLPLDFPVSNSSEKVFTGIEEVDRLSGGLPRGRITEIVGPDSSGRTSLLLSTLAQITDNEEVCGIVDSSGTFDPASAAHTGVDLERLLWIRTSEPDIDRALAATDLLLHGGGFGLIGVDFGSFSPAEIRRVPSSSWFRLQRAVRNTPTLLLFIAKEACSRTCASLVFRLGLDRIQWSSGLLDGARPRIEILRSRIHSGARWNRNGEHFRIRPAHFEAVGNDPTAVFPLPENEGAPCHER